MCFNNFASRVISDYIIIACKVLIFTMLKIVTWIMHYHHSNHKHVPCIFYYARHLVSTTDYIYFRPKLAAYINTSALIPNQSQSPSSNRDECMCIASLLVHIHLLPLPVSPLKTPGHHTKAEKYPSETLTGSVPSYNNYCCEFNAKRVVKFPC